MAGLAGRVALVSGAGWADGIGLLMMVDGGSKVALPRAGA